MKVLGSSQQSDRTADTGKHLINYGGGGGGASNSFASSSYFASSSIIGGGGGINVSASQASKVIDPIMEDIETIS